MLLLLSINDIILYGYNKIGNQDRLFLNTYSVSSSGEIDTIQMDIFPTNLLSNVLVIKSARADLPADFTGGVINIITKDFPTSEEFSFSVGTSFNPEMHLYYFYVLL